MDQHNTPLILTTTHGLLDLLLFCLMFGTLIYNTGFKRSRRDRGNNRRGRWRPELLYLPVLLLRWMFVPHRGPPRMTNENVEHRDDHYHRDHHHHHHHHHRDHNHDFIQKMGSSFMEEDEAIHDVRLPDILQGQ